MTVEATPDPQISGTPPPSNARALVAVLCVAALLACVTMPLFGWVVAFGTAIRLAVLARRGQSAALLRRASWAMLALGLVYLALMAILWGGSDQAELTGTPSPGAWGAQISEYASAVVSD